MDDKPTRTYLIVNHFPRGNRNNGINSYFRLLAHNGVPGFRVRVLSNDGDLSREAFRAFVAKNVAAQYDPDEVVIEAAENGAPSLAVPERYRVHVRLHTPHALLNKYRGEPIDMDRLNASVEAIRRATVVSSPSYALLDELGGYIDASRVHVFKNPPPAMHAPVAPERRRYDLLFMGRNDAAKGFDFLAPLLERLPGQVRVAICGRDSEGFRVGGDVACAVEAFGLVPAGQRSHLIARSRLLVLPSRFENCSMSVLEALAAGTCVVAWDRGGTGEIAPEPLIRSVPFGDLDAYAEAIVQALDDAAPAEESFRLAVQALDGEFRAGLAHVVARLDGDVRGAPFQGFSHARSCAARIPDPREARP